MPRRSACALLAVPLLAAATVVPRVHAARQSSQFTVEVSIDSNPVYYNGTGSVSAHTRIGATCTPKVTYTNGRLAQIIESTGAQTAGQSGLVRWSFAVGSGQTKGTATVTCRLKGQTRSGHASFSMVPTPAAATPSPPVNPTYYQVNDHPADWYQQPVSWKCAIAKFLGDDPSNSGATTIACDESTFSVNYPEGEVILSVPRTMSTSNLDTQFRLRVTGTVDRPWQGLNAYGGSITLPQIDVTNIELVDMG